ncbi:MAG: transglutaminase family protein [Ilumatobacteraceae bacterium]
MGRISTHCELRYTVSAPSSFYFAVLAARGTHQHVVEERLIITPDLPVTRMPFGPAGHDVVRVVTGPGQLWLLYDATVELSAFVPLEIPRAETAFADVPSDVLGFLHPSRFCQSDMLTRLATNTFGQLPAGFERVTGICNWVYDHLEYVPGSTDASSTAVDVLVEGAGVCRDYAHLSIAFCRALGIPARYVSGYAVDLDPPDFHGFFEAYIGDAWYLFDATRMAPVDGLVRIAAGRDAADVAFAAFTGAATLDAKNLVTIDLERTAPNPARTTAAISTA